MISSGFGGALSSPDGVYIRKMLRNRSVPVDTVLPHIAYPDVAQAIAWLGRVFGFREHYRYGDPGTPQGAQIVLHRAVVQLHSVRESRPYIRGMHSLTVFLEDVETHFERTRTAGAKILEEVHETCYGERQYAAEDLEGNHWIFSRHATDLSPADWGATMSSEGVEL